jgi:hypothetical protein
MSAMVISPLSFLFNKLKQANIKSLPDMIALCQARSRSLSLP